MPPTLRLRILAAICTAAVLTLPGTHAAVSNEALMAKIKDLEAQLADLKAKVDAGGASGRPADKKKPAAAGDRVAEAATQASDGGVDAKKHASKALTIKLKDLKDNDVKLKDIASAFDVPDSPAAAVVGVPQDKVQHFRTPKELGAAVINGVDDKGHFQSGLSVDFAPAQLTEWAVG